MSSPESPPTESPESPTTNEAPAYCRTLADILRWRAEHQPDSLALVFLDEQEREHARLSFAELDARARVVAARLTAMDLRGANAILLYPMGADFITAFFGCLYAGVIAVPLPPGDSPKAASRLRSVLTSCAPRVVLTTAELRRTLDLDLPVVETAAIIDDGASFQPYAAAPDDVAFLQYTSGSTSTPKGTMVSHGNILVNQAMLRRFTHTHSGSVIVSWLPPSHDMGLIGNLLTAVYLGARAVLLSTETFIRDPLSWLRAVSRYRGTYSCAPNFAFELCVTRSTPETRAGLDLGSWDYVVSGAEPIRQETLEAFAATFLPYGLRRDRLAPSYGLAEATLAVTSAQLGPASYLTASREALKLGRLKIESPDFGATQVLVSCGTFDNGDQTVKIVHPASRRECAPDEIGEIWIAGTHVAKGYWRDPQATEESFNATLGDGRRYLRTGDLGFVRDRALFVTGRIKDLIIFAGENHYPQDIELTVERACPTVRKGCVAAFTLEGDDEGGVTILAELGRAPAGFDTRAALATIRAAVGERHQLPVRAVTFIEPRSLPKTTSGKIQRRLSQQELLSGAYTIIAEWRRPAVGDAPAEAATPADVAPAALSSWLAAWLGGRLGISDRLISPAAPFADFGVTSIVATEMAQALSDKLGRKIDPALLWRQPTIAALAQHLTGEPEARSRPAIGSAPAAARDQALLLEIAALEAELIRRGT